MMEKLEGWFAVILFVVTIALVLLVMFAINRVQHKIAREKAQDKMIDEAYGSYAILTAGLKNFTGQLVPAFTQIATMQNEIGRRLTVLEARQPLVTPIAIGNGRTIGECYGVMKQNSTDFDLSCLLKAPVVVDGSSNN